MFWLLIAGIPLAIEHEVVDFIVEQCPVGSGCQGLAMPLITQMQLIGWAARVLLWPLVVWNLGGRCLWARYRAGRSPQSASGPSTTPDAFRPGLDAGERANSARLRKLLAGIAASKEPEGWAHVATVAVGGLLSVGFAEGGRYLLVVSSQGRGLIDCDSGEKVARDTEPYAGLSADDLSCQGIGPVADETIRLSAYGGGGLPQHNAAGDSLALVMPDWPVGELILCANHKSALVPGDQARCTKIYREHVSAFGFSPCGNYIVAACGSDFDVWKRGERL